jgi:hypothetical protein
MIENSTYALLDDNNIVVNVISVSSEDEKAKGFLKIFFWLNEEDIGIRFCQNLIGDKKRKTKWKKGYQPLNPENRKRVHYPAKGYKYDEKNDVFIPPQPFPSWSLNKKTWDWDPPIPTPKIPHFWNEEDQKWIPII